MVVAPLARRGVVNVKKVKKFQHDREAAIEFFKMLVDADPSVKVEVIRTEWWGDGGFDYEYDVVVYGSDEEWREC